MFATSDGSFGRKTMDEARRNEIAYLLFRSSLKKNGVTKGIGLLFHVEPESLSSVGIPRAEYLAFVGELQREVYAEGATG